MGHEGGCEHVALGEMGHEVGRTACGHPAARLGPTSQPAAGLGHGNVSYHEEGGSDLNFLSHHLKTSVAEHRRVQSEN